MIPQFLLLKANGFPYLGLPRKFPESQFFEDIEPAMV